MRVLSGGGAVAMTVMVAVLCGVAFLTSPAAGYVTAFPEEPDIDGMFVTVGWAIAEFLAGMMPYPTVSSLLLAIIHAWEPKPEDNYWEHVQENVAQVCGDFINQQNLQQVAVYKQDLVGLLRSYERADVESDGTYPNKNTVADSITTSVISNRYLIEAALLPSSMTVDFSDIASVHILVLKDVAESYTVPNGVVSRWWLDLSRELDHYIAYAVFLEGDTITWRDTQIECFMDIGSGGYDEYVITDHVRKYSESCKQLHVDDGEVGPCTTFCDLYQHQVNRDDTRWLWRNLGVAKEQWSQLKLQADYMAQMVSMYYNPFTRDQ